jgi:phage gp36-like protein
MARPYSTLDDWKKICPEETIRRLTVDPGDSASVIDETRVSECIAAADGEIEPYLEAAGWTIPLGTVPDLIRNFSATIGIYKAHQRKVAEVPKSWRTAYTDAIAYLKDIRDGKMKLPTSGTAPGDVIADFASGSLITDHFS